MTITPLEKQPYDQRLFEVSVANAIRETEAISRVASIEVAEGSSDLTISDIAFDASVIAFLVSGGNVGLYTLIIRFSLAGVPAQEIEVDIPLIVQD